MTAGIAAGPAQLDGMDYGQMSCRPITANQRSRMEADARLIAKAPAMYDALHSARHALANASMAAGEGEDGPMAKVVAEIDAALGGGE